MQTRDALGVAPLDNAHIPHPGGVHLEDPLDDDCFGRVDRQGHAPDGRPRPVGPTSWVGHFDQPIAEGGSPAGGESLQGGIALPASDLLGEAAAVELVLNLDDPFDQHPHGRVPDHRPADRDDLHSVPPEQALVDREGFGLDGRTGHLPSSGLPPD